MIRGLCLMIALMLAAPAVQAQQEIEPGDIRLELQLEPREHAPHPGEMILLSIHGTYKIPVIREVLKQPALDGVGWMQLGEDRWYKAREDGFEVLKMERRMALFPDRPGEILISPFTHALEMLGRTGRTVPIDVASDSVTLRVADPLADVGWWFPVRRIEISDAWSNQPETLDPGAAALRVVALTVEGTEPQRIPPMPEMTGAGVHIFPHPEHRIVALGPAGPVTRVFWRWTVRPHQGKAGYINPVAFSYFDAEAREMQTIELSAQRIAYAGGAMAAATEALQGAAPLVSAPGNRALPVWAVPAGLIAGLGLGLALLMRAWGVAGFTLPRVLRADPDKRGLARAVRQGDAAAVWRHARSILAGRSHPEAFRKLEAALFAGRNPPPLADVARAVRSARRG